MKLTKIPIKNTKQIISRSVEESIILINVNNKDACSLEDFNLCVWKKINGKRNINEIIRSLSEEFNVVTKKLKEHTIRTINKLKRTEFIDFKAED